MQMTIPGYKLEIKAFLTITENSLRWNLEVFRMYLPESCYMVWRFAIVSDSILPVLQAEVVLVRSGGEPPVS